MHHRLTHLRLCSDVCASSRHHCRQRLLCFVFLFFCFDFFKSRLTATSPTPRAWKVNSSIFRVPPSFNLLCHNTWMIALLCVHSLLRFLLCVFVASIAAFVPVSLTRTRLNCRRCGKETSDNQSMIYCLPLSCAMRESF